MNYFNPFPLEVDDTTTVSWDTLIAETGQLPWLKQIVAERGAQLFPRFAAAYAHLRALPRGTRRAIQRRLMQSRESAAQLQEWLQKKVGGDLQYKLARTLAGAALLLALGQGPSAEAADIVVNATIPGIAADGKCSLIEAIVNANSDMAIFPDCPAGSPDPIGDRIILPAKKAITLTAPYVDYYGPTGLPVITSMITIEGNGAKITRKKGSPEFRLMAVGSGDLKLSNVTLGGGISAYGGAINNYGYLTIANSTITGNAGDYGGAISNSGDLTVVNSTISKNTGDAGGGIANLGIGSLSVSNSTITGNKANYGGAIFSASTGGFTISGSAISKNSALYGGGINSQDCRAAINNSTITGNTANIQTITYKDNGYTYTYFSGGYGGGIAMAPPKSCVINGVKYDSNLTIRNSTITGNKALGKSVKYKYDGYTYTSNYGGGGGGIHMDSNSNLVLYGTKVTGNSASFYGGGVMMNGGDLAYDATSNISGNKAKYGPNVY